MCIDLEQTGKTDTACGSDSTKTKSTHFIFESSIDWKPVQSAKMSCNVVCLGNFQDEAGCIVLKILNSVFKVLGASGKEGIAIIQS